MDAKEWIQGEVNAGPSPDSSDETYRYLLQDGDSGVSVREAVSSDARTLAAIGRRSFHHAHAAVLHPVDLAGAVSRFDNEDVEHDLTEPDSRWLVALWNGETVGFAQLRSATVPESLPGRLPIELRGIFVAPDWSGHGVGSALIEASSQLALSLGHESLWVRVFAANRDAVSFLQGWGFTRVHHEIVAGRRSAAPVLTLSRPLPVIEPVFQHRPR